VARRRRRPTLVRGAEVVQPLQRGLQEDAEVAQLLDVAGGQQAGDLVEHPAHAGEGSPHGGRWRRPVGPERLGEGGLEPWLARRQAGEHRSLDELSGLVHAEREVEGPELRLEEA
jgi:hypothetical protein